jgi:hypothetical protein
VNTFRFRAKGLEKQKLPNAGQRVDASFLAALVGVSRQHITQLCRNGAIPGRYQSKGGHWRFRWSGELSNWVAGEIRYGSKVAPDSSFLRRAEIIAEEMVAWCEIGNLANAREKALRKALRQCGERAFLHGVTQNADRYIAGILKRVQQITP